jgi:hypothetical protein
MLRNPFSRLYLTSAVFLLLFSFSPGRIATVDVALRQSVARSLWAHGTVFVPGSTEQGNPGLIFPRPGHGGTTFYGIVQSVAFIPFDALASLGKKLAPSLSTFPHWDQIPLAMLYIPLIGTLWWLALVFLLTECGFSIRNARLAALMCTFFSTAFAYSAQSAQEESLVGALCTSAVALWLRALRTGSFPSAAYAGGLTVLALGTRLNAIWFALPALGATVDSLRHQKEKVPWSKAIAGFLVGALSLSIPLAAFNAWRFGHVLSSGYDRAQLQGLGVTWASFQPEVFAGLLWGMGKGLFITSPLFLCLFFYFYSSDRKHHGLAAGTVLSWVLSCGLCAFILNNPDGSESWGARYQIHLLGFGIAPVFVGWQWIRARSSRLAVGILALSAVPQGASLLAPDAYEYLQAHEAHASQQTLMTDFSRGQLGRRLLNIASWVAGAPPTSPALSKMERAYVPHVWGFVWAKRMPTLSLTVVCFGVWLLCLSLGLGLLWRGIQGLAITRATSG